MFKRLEAIHALLIADRIVQRDTRPLAKLSKAVKVADASD